MSVSHKKPHKQTHGDYFTYSISQETNFPQKKKTKQVIFPLSKINMETPSFDSQVSKVVFKMQNSRTKAVRYELSIKASNFIKGKYNLYKKIIKKLMQVDIGKDYGGPKVTMPFYVCNQCKIIFLFLLIIIYTYMH